MTRLGSEGLPTIATPPSRHGREGGHPRQQASRVINPVGLTRCKACVLINLPSPLTLVVGGRLLRARAQSLRDAAMTGRERCEPRH